MCTERATKATVPRSWTSSWARAPKPCISISSRWAQRKMYEEMLFLKTFVFFQKRDALSQDFRVHQPKIFVAQDDQPPKWVKLIAKLSETLGTQHFWGMICFSVLQCDPCMLQSQPGKLGEDYVFLCVFLPIFPQRLRLEPWHHERDLTLESAVVSVGLDVRKFTAMVMKFEPWEVGDNYLGFAGFLQFTNGQHACKLLEYMSKN